MRLGWQGYLMLFLTVLGALFVYGWLSSDESVDFLSGFGDAGSGVVADLSAGLKGCSDPDDIEEVRASARRLDDWIDSGGCTCRDAEHMDKMFGWNLLSVQECCQKQFCRLNECEDRALCERVLEDDG